MDQQSSTPIRNEWPYTPEFQDFANFLGLPSEKDSRGINWRYDDKTAKKIEEVYLWGKNKSEGGDHIRTKLAVKELQKQLGVNWKGKTLVDHLWQYITISRSNNRNDELKLLEVIPESAESNTPTSIEQKPNLEKKLENKYIKQEESLRQEVEQEKRRLGKQSILKEDELNQKSQTMDRQLQREKLRIQQEKSEQEMKMYSELETKKLQLEKKYMQKKYNAERTIQEAIAAAKIEMGKVYETKLTRSLHTNSQTFESEKVKLEQEHKQKLQEMVQIFLGT